MIVRNKQKDSTWPVIAIIVTAVLFVFGSLMYQAFSGREAYRAEYAAHEQEWQEANAEVLQDLPVGQAGEYDLSVHQ